MSRNDFMFQVQAMLDEAFDDIERVVGIWQGKIVDYLVIANDGTPGPGNQYEATEYIATGRLRAGWQFTTGSPPGNVPKMGVTGAEDGDQYAASTRGRLKAEMHAAGIQAISFLYNEVGYGYWVHEGIETHAHIGRRPFAAITAARSGALFREAMAEARVA